MCLLLTITNTLAAPTTNTTTTTTNSTLSTVIKVPSSISSSSSSSIEVSTNVIRKASLLHALSPESYASNSHLRKRHSKRHSNIVGGFDLDVNSTTLEWVNPCGGYYDPTDVPNIKPNRTAILKKVKEIAEDEFIGLKDNHSLIDTKSFKTWTLHKKRYDFLKLKLKWKSNIPENPRRKSKLKKRSKVSLKRLYRSLQPFVATFAYLWRMQEKTRRCEADKALAIELNSLLKSSLSMLCELETAINKTHPNHQTHNHLRQISRDEMNSQLNLLTRQYAIENPTAKHEVRSIDMIYAKVYYKRFLKNIISEFTSIISENEANKKSSRKKTTHQTPSVGGDDMVAKRRKQQRKAHHLQQQQSRRA